MDNKDLAALYRLRFAEAELPRKNAIWKVICEKFLQKYVSSTDTVIDVACGYGEFINNIRAGEKIGIDLNPDTASHLGKDVRFSSLDAMQLAGEFESQADVVFTSNFLEHLPDKPSLEQLLDQILLSLKPGGRYLILGPNLRYLNGKYWDFYDHHLGLTHLSLCEALAMRGFEIEQCYDRFLPYTTQGALPTHPALVHAYLSIPLLWRFMGKQFFIVARKEA